MNIFKLINLHTNLGEMMKHMISLNKIMNKYLK